MPRPVGNFGQETLTSTIDCNDVACVSALGDRVVTSLSLTSLCTTPAMILRLWLSDSVCAV